MSGKRKRSDIVGSKKKQKVEENTLNPFELRVNKRKHDVLCLKSKSDKGAPGVSRSRAIQKRKKTLLEEYKRRNKSNKFVDRRFGEYDETLSAEEKMMQRFMLEKQKKHDRGAMYNLPGDETDQLTHYGQSLGDMESFDDIRITSDEEDVEEDIRHTHFGGFLKKKSKDESIGDSDRPGERSKTRKEILGEVVAKSKAQKYERQQLKQKTEDLLHDIDEQWKAVQGLVPKASPDDDKPPPDDYDMTVRKMTFEARGKPTDSLKSEAELAALEKERLEKQELERVCRMKGLPLHHHKQHVSADHIGDKSKKRRVQFVLSYDKDGRPVMPDGEMSEDLEGSGDEASLAVDQNMRHEKGDDNQSDEESGDQSEVADESGDQHEVADESGDQHEVAELYGSDLESEDSCDDEDSDDCSHDNKHLGECSHDNKDSERDTLDNKKDNGKHVHSEKVEAEMQQASKELPFVLKVPSSLEEWKIVIHNRSPEECKTAVDRIYTCNHPSLGPQNKEKLKGFLMILVEYCLRLAEVPSAHAVTVINGLAHSLFKLAQIDSVHSATVFREHLELLHDHTHNLPHQYPPYSSLLVFKIISTLFPTSDHRHPVTTPAMLIMGYLLRKAIQLPSELCLLQCHVRSMEDICKGLMIAETFIEYVGLSKRFVPEAVTFLTSVLGYFSIGRQGIVYPPFVQKCVLKTELSKSTVCGPEVATSSSVSLLQIIEDISLRKLTTPTPTFKNAVAVCSSRQLQKLTEIYADIPSFSEIFQAAAANLESLLSQESWPLCVKSAFGTTLQSIRSKSVGIKPTLQLLKHKPFSIPFYKPAFDEEYEVGRKRAVNRPVQERQRLMHKVKREMKGAVREIRRDTAFLAREKLKEQLERDAERERKTREIMQDLEEIQHESKKERRRNK